MAKKRSEEVREGEKYRNAWEEMYRDRFERVEPFLDVAKCRRLLYDTFHYFRKYMEYNSVLRADLEAYKYICLFAMEIGDYPENCRQYEFECCLDYAAGLCRAIESGFRRGYYKIGIPLGNRWHIPAGCSKPEADLSSYESYEKGFRKTLIAYMREEENDAYDEDEELRRITAAKDT